MSEDIRARIEKLLADAADCEIVSNLAVDVRKRAQFRRLADQYKAMAAHLQAQLDRSDLKRTG